MYFWLKKEIAKQLGTWYTPPLQKQLLNLSSRAQLHSRKYCLVILSQVKPAESQSPPLNFDCEQAFVLGVKSSSMTPLIKTFIRFRVANRHFLFTFKINKLIFFTKNKHYKIHNAFITNFTWWTGANLNSYSYIQCAHIIKPTHVFEGGTETGNFLFFGPNPTITICLMVQCCRMYLNCSSQSEFSETLGYALWW